MSSNSTTTSLNQLGQNQIGNLATLTGLAPSNNPVTINSVASSGLGNDLSAVNNVPSMPPIYNSSQGNNYGGSIGLPPSPSNSVLSSIPGFQYSPMGSSVSDVNSAFKQNDGSYASKYNGLNNNQYNMQKSVPIVTTLPSTTAGSGAISSNTPSRLSVPSKLRSTGTPSRISNGYMSMPSNVYTAPRIVSSSPQTTNSEYSPTQKQILVSSASGPVQNDDVEVSLIRHKYIPQDRIFTRGADGQVVGRFIKVLSPSGATALVDVNVDGVMAVTKNDMTTVEIESSKALDIPLEVKTGALSCTGNGVCGVAFECSNGLCTMSKGSDMQPRETHFLKVSEVAEEAAVVGSSPFAIPIVKLSEILENPTDVDRKINSSTSRIFEASFLRSQQELKNLQESLNRLNSEYGALNNNLNAASNNVKVTINELSDYNERFKSSNVTCEIEIAKHAKVVEELEARNELYKGLLNLCKIVGNNIDAVDALTQNFKDINNVVRKDYGNLDRKITEPIVESSIDVYKNAYGDETVKYTRTQV